MRLRVCVRAFACLCVRAYVCVCVCVGWRRAYNLSSSGRRHVDSSFFTKEQVMARDVFHAFATHVGLVHDITATSFL